MDPIVYEYHHHPSQYGQYSNVENELKCFDYSHGDHRSGPTTPLVKEAMYAPDCSELIEEKTAKAAAVQLFPSAASIENSNVLKPCFPINNSAIPEGKIINILQFLGKK